MTNTEVQSTDGTVSLSKLTATDGACVNYDKCGNVVPGNGEMCGSCLDEARHDPTQAPE